MTTKSEAFKKEHLHRKEDWQNELESLGLEPKRQNGLNDGQSSRHWQKSYNSYIIKTIKQLIAMSTIIFDTAVSPKEMNNYERLIHTDLVHCICSTTNIFPYKMYAKLEMLLFFP